MDKIEELEKIEINTLYNVVIDLGSRVEMLEHKYNEIMKWRDKQNKINRVLMQKVYEIDTDKIKIDDE